MGALARVRVHYVNNLSEVLAQFQTAGYPVYGTLLDGKNMYVPTAIPTKEKGIIVMGNEGNGVTPEIDKLSDHRLYIRSYPVGVPTSESLNVSVATAIVCAEFRRR